LRCFAPALLLGANSAQIEAKNLCLRQDGRWNENSCGQNIHEKL